MALDFRRTLIRDLTQFDNIMGQWAAVGLGYALAIASIGSVAIPWQHPAQKALRILLPVAGMVANMGASWKVRELQLMHPYLEDRAIARRDIGATVTAAQAMPYLQQPSQTVQTTAALMPASDANQNQLYDWQRLIWEAVGIIIAGNSGYGKTSVACFLLGLLTQNEPKKIIICDPHFNKIWQQLGLTSIGRIQDIERQLIEYVKEMDRRYDALADGVSSEFEPMVIVLDELGKCQSKFADPSFIETAIARLGCEGRKVGMTAIIICHSQNVEDMGISKKLRNNYALILLGSSALDEAEKWKAGDDKRLFVESQSYPCMLSGSVRNCPALHPTHHQYQQYRIQGNQPLNLLPINQIHGGDPSGDSEAARPSICLDKSPTQDHAITQNPALREWFDHLYRLDSRNHAELGDTPLECPDCASRNISRHAKNRNGSQRYRCGECGKTFTI